MTGRRKTLRVLIWMFLSVLQRRDRRGRFSSTVTARRDTWLAATVPVSRLPTFATGASTAPTAPTKVAGAVRKNGFFVIHSLSLLSSCILYFFFFFRSTDARNDPDGALPCDPGECHLPDCWCSKDGRTIPGNLTVSTVPQMIAVTFDDAVNGENIELFSSRENQPRY